MKFQLKESTKEAELEIKQPVQLLRVGNYCVYPTILTHLLTSIIIDHCVNVSYSFEVLLTIMQAFLIISNFDCGKKKKKFKI